MPSPFEPSIREQQVVMSLLAHLARHDTEAVAASMVLVADGADDIRPLSIIAGLLEQFHRGLSDLADSAALADWFAEQARMLAARAPAR
jgi:hypothetical protein